MDFRDIQEANLKSDKRIKLKLSELTGMRCCCILSLSQCHSTSSCRLFFSFAFICATFYFIFFWVIFFLAFLFTFSCPCGLLVFQVAHICDWKSSNIPLVGFACVCVFFFSLQDCCGIWRLFMACFLTSVELWPIEICGVEKEEHKASQCMWKERLGQKGKLSDFHKQNPYLKTRWGLTSTSEPSCQQPIQASPWRTAPFYRKQAKGSMRPNGIGGCLSLHTQLVVSAINQYSLGITGAVFCAAVWPIVWPHYDCSLG